MSITITNLLRIQSQLADSCLAYLNAAIRKLAKQPLLDRFGRSLDDAGLRIALHVEPFAVARFRDAKAQRERERDNTLPWVAYLDSEHRLYARRGTLDEDESRDGHSQRELLHPLLEELEVAMVLGDPGSGKSECLKGFAVRTARVKFEQIRGRLVLADDVCLPVFAELPKVAETFGAAKASPHALREFAKAWSLPMPGDLSTRLRLAILKAALERLSLDDARGRGKCAPAVAAIWRTWDLPPSVATKQHEQAVIMLDAWDEIAEKHRSAPFIAGLRQFTQSPPARLLITSRILGYDAGVFGIQTGAAAPALRRELVICRFRFSDCEAFIRAFFPERGTAAKLIDDLRAKPMVMGMLQNPLLATLVCVAFDPDLPGAIPVPIRQSEAYNRVVRCLLGEEEANRKHAEHQRLDQEAVEETLSVFRSLAFELFPDEVLTRPRLAAFCRHYKLQAGSSLRPHLKRHRLTLNDFLLRTGLIAAQGSQELRFLHLTLQEYLAGGHLAESAGEGWSRATIEIREPEGERRKLPLRRFVDGAAWHPRWCEVIALFAGQLENPEPLLALLVGGEDDILHHRLHLGLQCLAHSSPRSGHSGHIASQIGRRIWSLIMNAPHELARDDRAFRHLAMANPPLREGETFASSLLRTIRHGDRKEIQVAMDVIAYSRWGMVGSDILDELLEIFRKGDYKMAWRIGGAIATIGFAMRTNEILGLVGSSLTSAETSPAMRSASEHIAIDMGAATASPDFARALEAVLSLPGSSATMVSSVLKVIAKNSFVRDTMGARPGLLRRLSIILRRSVDYDLLDLALSIAGDFGSKAGTPGILKGLARCLQIYLPGHNYDRSLWIHVEAVRVVGRIGEAACSPEVLDALIDVAENFENYWDHDEMDELPGAIAALGPRAVTPQLLDLLARLVRHPPSIGYLQFARAVLANLGRLPPPPGLLSTLVKLTKDTDGIDVALIVGEMGMTALIHDFMQQIELILSDPKSNEDEIVSCVTVLLAMYANAELAGATEPLEKILTLLMFAETREVDNMVARSRDDEEDSIEPVSRASLVSLFAGVSADEQRLANEVLAYYRGNAEIGGFQKVLLSTIHDPGSSRMAVGVAVSSLLEIDPDAARPTTLAALAHLLFYAPEKLDDDEENGDATKVCAAIAKAVTSLGEVPAKTDFLAELAEAIRSPNLGACVNAKMLVRSLGEMAITERFLANLQFMLRGGPNIVNGVFRSWVGRTDASVALWVIATLDSLVLTEEMVLAIVAALAANRIALEMSDDLQVVVKRIDAKVASLPSVRGAIANLVGISDKGLNMVHGLGSLLADKTFVASIIAQLREEPMDRYRRQRLFDALVAVEVPGIHVHLAELMYGLERTEELLAYAKRSSALRWFERPGLGVFCVRTAALVETRLASRTVVDRRARKGVLSMQSDRENGRHCVTVNGDQATIYSAGLRGDPGKVQLLGLVHPVPPKAGWKFAHALIVLDADDPPGDDVIRLWEAVYVTGYHIVAPHGDGCGDLEASRFSLEAIPQGEIECLEGVSNCPDEYGEHLEDEDSANPDFGELPEDISEIDKELLLDGLPMGLIDRDNVVAFSFSWGRHLLAIMSVDGTIRILRCHDLCTMAEICDERLVDSDIWTNSPSLAFHPRLPILVSLTDGQKSLRSGGRVHVWELNLQETESLLSP